MVYLRCLASIMNVTVAASSRSQTTLAWGRGYMESLFESCDCGLWRSALACYEEVVGVVAAQKKKTGAKRKRKAKEEDLPHLDAWYRRHGSMHGIDPLDISLHNHHGIGGHSVTIDNQ